MVAKTGKKNGIVHFSLSQLAEELKGSPRIRRRKPENPAANRGARAMGVGNLPGPRTSLRPTQRTAGPGAEDVTRMLVSRGSETLICASG